MKDDLTMGPRRAVETRGFWNKKAVVSYVLCTLVCLLHAYTAYYYDNTGTGITAVINDSFVFFKNHVLCPIAVPLFFIISGYAFFRNFSIKKYPEKLRSRVKTLVIPYLIWNTVGMLFLIVTSYSFVSRFFVGRQPFELSVKNILLSIFLWKGNGQFWFIFDLIVFIVISPLIYCLIKNKYIGIISIVAILALYQFGIRLPYSVFYDGASIVYFMFGALLGIHGKRLFAERAGFGGRIAYTAAFFIAMVFMALHESGIIPLPDSAYVILLSAYSFSFWKACDWFSFEKECRPFVRRSFMVYAMHVNIVAIISKLLYLTVFRSPVFIIPNIIVSVALTLVFINWFCVLLQKISPKLYPIVSGERG